MALLVGGRTQLDNRPLGHRRPQDVLGQNEPQKALFARGPRLDPRVVERGNRLAVDGLVRPESALLVLQDILRPGFVDLTQSVSLPGAGSARSDARLLPQRLWA